MVVAGTMFCVGITFIIGKQEFRWKGKKTKLGKPLGVFFIIWSILASYPVILDSFEEHESQVVEVIDTRNGGSKIRFKRIVITRDHGDFINMYNKFDFRTKGVYEITYLPHSKIILDVTKHGSPLNH